MFYEIGRITLIFASNEMTMKRNAYFLVTLCLLILSCQKENNETVRSKINEVEYAEGFEIERYDDFTIVRITKPWPDASQIYTYVCASDSSVVPDSLKQNFIKVPVETIVVTSTTHVSSLVALGLEEHLIGFPHLNYISSPEVRRLIDDGKVQEISDQQNLNFEKTLDLQPDVIIGLSMDSETSRFNQFVNAGIPVLYNADWVETTPLGKAEWIKFFGVLFDRQMEAKWFFDEIVLEYTKAKELVRDVHTYPKVLSGSIFQDVWYAPQGESWMASFITAAKGDYVWKDTKGTGSLSLSLEAALEHGSSADVWIGPGQFTTYKELESANKHYREFKAFQKREVYSYSIKKGESGGIIFYEDAQNRPDLVLKDLIYSLHPEVLPDYEPVFIEVLK